MTKRDTLANTPTNSIKTRKKIQKRSNDKKISQVQPIEVVDSTADSKVTAPNNDTLSNDILDPDYYFDADTIHASGTMGCAKVLSYARHTILELLKSRDYRPCLALLSAMIETCKFRPLAYWKVGEEIIRNCQPEDLSMFLGSVVSGIRAPKNIPVWKEQLLHILNEEGYIAFIERIESAIESQNNNQSISKLEALVMYETWEQTTNNQGNVDKMHRLLYDTEEQLSKAYHMNSADRYIIKAYLKVLSVIVQMSKDDEAANGTHTLYRKAGTQKRDRAVKIKQVVDTALQMEINDPELMCILLHYGPQGLDDNLNIAIGICSEDPVADARIKFLPTMRSMKSVLVTDPEYTSITMARVSLIVERLEHGVTDSCTLDELDELLNDLENGLPHIRYNVVSFFASINLFSTLEFLQLGVHDENIIALDTLEFLKFKVAGMTPQ
ncbi:hypothetical protein BCR42DRAFT_424024 [Absidia repens]|uniref:Uncharacterized protein n=1 Tax=Absidia repens TaxID=90262 RepID=A0A1X2I660_9FUNG|nr:hypothetical protein BCR42DRAFT_424024 [Absidia repens]